MSNDLNIPQLSENQTRPDITTNDATQAMANAIANKFDCDLTSGNVVVTAAQYRNAMLFRAVNAATGGRTVTLPQVEREFVVVECVSTNTNNVSLVRGATTITMIPGRVYLARTDGTANGLAAFDIGALAGTEINDLTFFFPNVMVNNQLLFSGKAAHAYTLPINLTGSSLYCGTAVTASTTLTLKKNGSAIGTAVIPTGTAGSFIFSADVTIDIGDILSIHGPATADATAADFSLTLKAKR
jgi:hypothetical protein